MINAPAMPAETNEELDELESVLAKFHIFCGFVPPGKHSIIIKHVGMESYQEELLD